jgi:hypothetical protein
LLGLVVGCVTCCSHRYVVTRVGTALGLAMRRVRSVGTAATSFARTTGAAAVWASDRRRAPRCVRVTRAHTAQLMPVICRKVSSISSLWHRVGVAHDGWLYVPQPGGIHHFKGTGSGADKYYCARRLGAEAIPGSDGQCGPNNGPQCAECRAYQAAQVGSGPSGAYRQWHTHAALVTTYTARVVSTLLWVWLAACVVSGMCPLSLP